MSDLINRIRAAQVRAAEDVVVANLQSMGLATESPRPALTPRDIAAMTAHAAGIKAENVAPVMPTLHVFSQYAEIELRTADGRTVAVLSQHFANIARRLADCWNAAGDTPTETLESCAHWSDIVKSPLSHRQHIPAEAAAVGAALDSESLEQGEVL